MTFLTRQQEGAELALAGSGPSTEKRPAGWIQPTHDRTIRAFAAIHEQRIRDAEDHLEAIPDDQAATRGWKRLAAGLIAIEKRDFAQAEPLFLQAAAWAWLDALSDSETDPRRASLRLAARAWEHLGWLYRHQDRPDDALRIHSAAFQLRAEHGSHEEMWETAVSLGLDADLARRCVEAQKWYRQAVDSAAQTMEQPDRKQAVAWTRLSASLTESGAHDQAVAAAKTAGDWWRRCDIAAATAAEADLRVGHALLKQGECLFEQAPDSARPALNEAIERLAAAKEALLAFGGQWAADAQWCSQQADFAERLRSSLP